MRITVPGFKPPPAPLPGATAAQKEKQARETAERIAETIQSGSADAMRALAHALEAQGNAGAAASLRQAAAAIEREEVTEAAREAAAFAARQQEIAQQAALVAATAATEQEKQAAAQAAREAAARALEAQETALAEAAAALAAKNEEERQAAAARAIAAQEEALREAAEAIKMALPVIPIDPKRALATELTTHLAPGPLSGPVRRGSENRELVKAFQRAMGTTVDGLYGPNTGYKVAALGVVPARPYYFSRYPTKALADKQRWTKAMESRAENDPERAREWLAAAEVARL